MSGVLALESPPTERHRTICHTHLPQLAPPAGQNPIHTPSNAPQ